jgi:hypothetical protein
MLTKEQFDIALKILEIGSSYFGLKENADISAFTIYQKCNGDLEDMEERFDRLLDYYFEPKDEIDEFILSLMK